MKSFKKLLSLLTPKERKSGNLLLVMILIMALLDMIGVASILPFMAVLANPTIIETNIILNKIFHTSKIFGVENNQQFLFFFRDHCICTAGCLTHFQSFYNLCTSPICTNASIQYW